MNYYLKARGAQTQEQHKAEIEAAWTSYRSLTRAQKAASKLCRAHGLKAEIYDARGWLVLRVDAAGWRAP